MSDLTTKVRYRDAIYALQGLSDPAVAEFVFKRAGDAYAESIYALRKVAAEYAQKMAEVVLAHAEVDFGGNPIVNSFAGIVAVDSGFFDDASELGDREADIDVPVVSLDELRRKNIPSYVKDAIGAILDQEEK